MRAGLLARSYKCNDGGTNCAPYVEGVMPASVFNGSAIGNPTIVGTTNLTWTGPFSIPGNAAVTLTFRA